MKANSEILVTDLGAWNPRNPMKLITDNHITVTVTDDSKELELKEYEANCRALA